MFAGDNSPVNMLQGTNRNCENNSNDDKKKALLSHENSTSRRT